MTMTKAIPVSSRPELELGQRVTFTHIAKARYVQGGTAGRYGPTRRELRREVLQWADGGWTKPKTLDGVFVGWRNAQEGITRYDEDGPQFEPTNRPLVALIAYDERRNPVMVFPEDVTPCLNLEDRRLAAKIDAVAELDYRLHGKFLTGEASEAEVSVGLDVIRSYRRELGEVGQ